MASIFISHSSKDNAWAQRLKAWLEDKQHRSLFLDFDRETGLKAGDLWEQQLYAKLRQCQSVLALVSRDWLDSRWCFAEAALAREKGKRLILARIDDADISGLFRDAQHLDFVCEEADAFARLEVGLAHVFDLQPDREPYPGLVPFDERDAGVFVGRDPEIASLLEMIESTRLKSRSGERLLLLLGASGSGKSSLVRAGVLPRLRRLPERWQLLPPMRPGLDPLRELAFCLATVLEQDLEAVASRLAPPDRDGGPLQVLTDEIRLRAGQPEAAVLLVLDQMEELLGLSEAQACGRFLDVLRRALEHGDGRFLVLATLRSEYLGEVQLLPFLTTPGPLPYREQTLDPVPLDRLDDIIRVPGQRWPQPVEFAVRLVQRMIRDTGTRDALPLLAFTLNRLWRDTAARADGVFQLEEYGRLGGLEGSVRTAADEALDLRRRTPAELEALPTAFVPGLVRVNAEGVRTRRRAFLTDLTRATRVLLNPFVDLGLLVTNRDPEGRETIEVAHEALLRTWPHLDTWLKKDQGALRLLDGIERAARDWEHKGRSPDLLAHRGARLAEMQDLLGQARFRQVIGDPERRYLEANIQAEAEREAREREERERRVMDAERIAEEQKKVARRTKIGALIALFLMLVAGAAGLYAWNRRGVAEQRLAEAKASLIWSNLEFTDEHELQPHEVDALWDLTTSEQPIRAAFLEQITENRSLVLKLASRPIVVLRAFGLRLTNEQAQTVLRSVLNAFKNTTDSDTLWSLAHAVQALPVQLSADQAQTALEPIRDAFKNADSTITFETLADAVRILASKLPEEETQRALDLVLNVSGKVGNPRALPGLAYVMRAFPVPPSPAQEQAALRPVFDASFRAALDPVDPETLRVLAGAGQLLPLQLRPDQAEAVLRRVLDASASTTNPQELSSLAKVIRLLPIELNTEQVQEALDPVLDASRKTTDADVLDSLVDAVQFLAPRLGAMQAQAALDLLLDILNEASTHRLTLSSEFDFSMLTWGVVHTVKDLVPQLDEHQAQAALDPVLDILEGASNSTVGAVAGTVGALAPKLTPEQAQTALHAILDAFPKLAAVDDDLEGLEQAARALAPRLTTEQSHATLRRVLNALGSSTRPEGLWVLAQIVTAFPVHLSAEQVQVALDPILGALDPSNNSHEIWSIASAVRILAPNLTAEQAQTALRAVFDALTRPTDGYALRVLALAVQALAPKLSAEARAGALRVVSSGLSAAGSAMEAVAWAGACEALVRDQPINEYVYYILETLKYPNTALEEINSSINAQAVREVSSREEGPGSATEYLLKRLHARLLDAQAVPSSGFENTVGWIAEHYSEVDLAHPSLRPAPLAETASSIQLPD